MRKNCFFDTTVSMCDEANSKKRQVKVSESAILPLFADMSSFTIVHQTFIIVSGGTAKKRPSISNQQAIISYVLHCGRSNMVATFDSMTEVDHRNRIWFFPDKFWQATKNMPKDEAASLMAEVERFAAAGDVQALSKYPFVYVGDPYKKKKQSSAV
jgi:hypothetical protein